MLSPAAFLNSSYFSFSFTTEPGIECSIKICLFKFVIQCYLAPKLYMQMVEGLKVPKNLLDKGDYHGWDESLALMLPTGVKGSDLKWSVSLLYSLCRTTGLNLFRKTTRAHYPRGYNKLPGRHLASPICSC